MAAVGTKNTNVCPAGSVTMATEADCRSAATAMGNNNFYVYSWHNFPKGCFQSEGAMYWNTNTRGGSHPSARPICGGANGNRCKNKPCSCTYVKWRNNGESGGMTHSQRTDAGAASCQSLSFQCQYQSLWNDLLLHRRSVCLEVTNQRTDAGAASCQSMNIPYNGRHYPGRCCYCQ